MSQNPESTESFHLTADIIFEATDIDDAFQRIADHFQTLASGDELEDNTFSVGKIDIRPSTNPEPPKEEE